MKSRRTRVSTDPGPPPTYLADVLPQRLSGAVRGGAAWGSDSTEWYAWLKTDDAPTTPGMMIFLRYRFGWPWRCLQCDGAGQNGPDCERATELHAAFRANAGPHKGIQLPDWLEGGPNTPRRMLPIIPTLGFLFDTAFYGGVAWLAFFGRGVFRRTLRRRRRECIWCGYPVGSSAACTECGKPVGFQEPTSVRGT